VHWSELLSAWVLTRYADVVPALRNPDFSSERAPTFMRQLPDTVRQEMNPLSYHLSKWFGWNDPPYQTRLREAVSKAFTPEVVARMHPRIQNIVDELIGNVQGLGQMDVICDMANPLPVTVIAELLGVPQEYREKFKQGADDIVAFFGGPTLQNVRREPSSPSTNF